MFDFTALLDRPHHDRGAHAGHSRTRRTLCDALTSAFMLLLCLASADVGAQAEIRSLTGVMEGHEVGGVSVDMIGNVYAADFGDIVWKLTPEGQRNEFASGMYCRGNSVVKITTDGDVLPFAKSELFKCPYGMTFDREGNLCVVNLRGCVAAPLDDPRHYP